MKKNIIISFTEGRVVRDLIQNPTFYDSIHESYEITLATPAARIPSFVSTWEKRGFKVELLEPYIPSHLEESLMSVKKRYPHNPLIEKIWDVYENRVRSDFPGYDNLIQKIRPNLLITTNPMSHLELPLFRAAVASKVSTLGVIRSWDNLYKGFRYHPDHLAVWNKINAQEAMRLEGYHEDQLHVIGASQFDPYFWKDTIISREDFVRQIGFEPNRPIITLATLGSFLNQYDETYLMDYLIAAINEGIIPTDCQIICRLHPTSRVEYFEKYLQNPSVRLSYISKYIPSLGWTMDIDDVMFVANMLFHSDVLISPGSTLTIESAIFDTPTIVPIFHNYQPELGKIQYSNHLRTHFRRLKDLNLVPLINNIEDLGPAISRALSDRSWYRNERTQLVSDYVQFTDGNTTQRLAKLIMELS